MKQKIIWLLAQIFPGFFVKKAFAYLTHPMQLKIRPHEKIVLDKATKSRFTYRHFDIQLYQWGTGEKRILLVHGWEGHAGNFAAIIERLVENDYTVISFDGPSHGQSSKGKTSSFEFIELIRLLVEQYQPRQLISHSFGSVASLIALGSNPHLMIERYVGITVPNKFRERLEEIAQHLGLPYKVVRRLITKIEREHQVKVDTINVEDYAPKATIEKALLLHDTNDRVLPVEKSREVAKKWPAASLKEVTGTGHYKILGTKKVVDEILDFLSH
ncbi:MAG: alpha/beta fold hydrolase [Flavobacteriaceae bacterium]